MSIYNLNKFFEPRSIAIIGASQKEQSIGGAILQNLTQAGFKGPVFPVNPTYGKLLDIKCHPSLSRIDEPVDLAVITTPIQTVPGIIQECVKAGVGGAVVISAGGKEIGPAGREIEAAIKKEAQAGDIRIIGPNCVGILSAANRINASFAERMLQPGKMAFISQSGAICTAILDWSITVNIGFSHFVSVGSMLDVDFGDLIDYMGNDSQVDSILLYIESLSETRKFMSAARAVSRVKPIVVLKGGRSAAGAKAAASHTGALAGQDAVYDEAFKRAGIVRVNSMSDLFDCAELMAKQPRPRGRGLAIVTNSGGPAVMAADELAAYGLEPVPLSPETMQRLNDILPPFWSRGNPIDIIGDATPERYTRVIQVCMDTPEVHALLIMLCPQAMTTPTAMALAIRDILSEQRFPVFTVLMGGASVDQARHILNEAQIPTYASPERAIRAFWYMYSYDQNLHMLQETPPKLPRALHFNQQEAADLIRRPLDENRHILTEVESKDLLNAYGIPVNRTEPAFSVEEAVRLAREIGFPVAMKLLSHDITHKSDAGGVKLDILGEDQVRQSFDGIRESAHAYDPKAEFLGVSVQPMLPHLDFELILGSKKDDQFGPVILFGMGGIMTEVLRDRALGLPPLNALLAKRMMAATKVYKFLQGYRNRPGADLPLLEEILVRLSQLVTDFPEIVELDINPMVVKEDYAFALDARVVVEESQVVSPHHLVISPYPNQYETDTVTKGGLKVHVRPIKPEDAPLLEELFNILSPNSIYFRFCYPLKSFSKDMVVKFTQIDYDREVALVALDATRTEERMLGVARIINALDGRSAEFAIVVG
ncbi:MAG: acetate--CoA ligase family protein, partial [Thermodesulfobacteriota bacterium]|nr:acetate--CoA ligase family protein [Thermodesulfobacteriota bacterium]